MLKAGWWTVPSPHEELKLLNSEIAMLEKMQSWGHLFQSRIRLVEALERKAELERELGLDLEATYGN